MKLSEIDGFFPNKFYCLINGEFGIYFDLTFGESFNKDELFMFVVGFIFVTEGDFVKKVGFLFYHETRDAFIIIFYLKVGNLAFGSGRSSHAILFS